MDFNIVVIGDSFSGLHPSAGILAEYTGQVRIWSSGHGPMIFDRVNFCL
jgi:hypothetical protein